MKNITTFVVVMTVFARGVKAGAQVAAASFPGFGREGVGVSRDLKHRRRRAERTTTGSRSVNEIATAHTRLVVHALSRTPERLVCRPAVND